MASKAVYNTRATIPTETEPEYDSIVDTTMERAQNLQYEHWSFIKFFSQLTVLRSQNFSQISQISVTISTGTLFNNWILWVCWNIQSYFPSIIIHQTALVVTVPHMLQSIQMRSFSNYNNFSEIMGRKYQNKLSMWSKRKIYINKFQHHEVKCVHKKINILHNGKWHSRAELEVVE